MYGVPSVGAIMNEAESRPYQVSEITKLVKQLLEAQFYDLRVEGEISNFHPSSTGHLYFSLKDKDSMLQAVMFRGRSSSLNFKPEDGQLVIARGNISVYAKRGNYQLICESLVKAGDGDILALLEERKRLLAAEGLFDESRKRPLPLYPGRVAVVTSPTGAAIRDILRVIGRRNAGIDLIVLPAPVQGEAAAEIIARQIRTANRHQMADVIIVGRGGGSLEDLLPFSEEIVVRAIAESEIPVISAVGHEIDVTLSDLAADLRAPTPSAAAELVSSNREELLTRVRDIEAGMSSKVATRVERIRLLLRQFTPELLERNFQALMQPLLLRLDDTREQLIRGMGDCVTKAKHKTEILARELRAHSPRRTLERGYAIVTEAKTETEGQKLVTDSSKITAGQRIRIHLAKGRLGAQVEETHP